MIIMPITVSGVTTVDFRTINGGWPANKYIWIKNRSSDAVYASTSSDVAEGVNGSTEIPSGEAGMILMGSNSMIYISGDGDVEIKASDFAECPFKVQGKGGGSAGTVDYNTQVENKPKINNITVSGNKTFSDYGLEWVEPDVVSDIFDGTETINENDYVMYNNKLYKCTNEHTGAWDADDFELITIMDAIISGGSSSVNVIDEPTAAEIAASVAEIWG